MTDGVVRKCQERGMRIDERELGETDRMKFLEKDTEETFWNQVTKSKAEALSLTLITLKRNENHIDHSYGKADRKISYPYVTHQRPIYNFTTVHD